MRLINESPTCFKFKFKAKKVNAVAVDFIEDSPAGAVNIIARGDFRLKATIPVSELMEICAVKNLKDSYCQQFEKYKYPFLLYLFYTHFYGNKCKEETDVHVNGLGHRCASNRFGLCADGEGVKYMISEYSRSFDNGDSVIYKNPITMISSFKDYDVGMNRFTDMIEKLMNELSASSHEVNEIRKSYFERRGENIREIHAYKQKGSE
jgi:hypothetical protein